MPIATPLLDDALPDDPAEPSWYVMPIATPLPEALGEAPEFSRVVDAIGHIADTLARLAAEGVGHRDIKPANLFQLNDEWVIGDFGLVKYPEQERATKHNRALGPGDFMAPEMRRDADTASPEPADVYSLGKTLWSVATGQGHPPPGELRSDRRVLRLSSYVDDRRAALLESLLERCTSHEPTGRSSMREVAEELTSWSAPRSIPVQVDLSGYAEHVNRLREANVVTSEETEHERLSRLYNDALGRVHAGLLVPLVTAVEKSDLRNVGSLPRVIEGWQPDNYTGGATQPCWGIETIASPLLVASIGVVCRYQPAEDLADLGVTAIIALQTVDSQHNYLHEFEDFVRDLCASTRLLRNLQRKLIRNSPKFSRTS